MIHIRRQGGGERTIKRILGLSWAASCYYVCLRVSLSCTDRSCRRVHGCGHRYPQPRPGLLSHISTVCSADHIPLLPPLLLLSRPALSFRWLSAPNFFQHGPRLRRLCTTPVRNGYYPSTPHYNSTFDAFDPPPLPSLVPISVRPQPSLSHNLDLCLVDSPLPPTASLRRCAMPPVPIHLQTIQTNNLPRPCHTTTAIARLAFRTEQCFRALWLCLLRSSALHTSIHTILMPICSWFRSLGVL